MPPRLDVMHKATGSVVQTLESMKIVAPLSVGTFSQLSCRISTLMHMQLPIDARLGGVSDNGEAICCMLI